MQIEQTQAKARDVSFILQDSHSFKQLQSTKRREEICHKIYVELWVRLVDRVKRLFMRYVCA